MVTPVVAYLTMKGGVGKTTLAANLTRALADTQKRKILLIDADAQCNLSQVFLDDEAIEKSSSRSLYQAFDTAGRPQGPSELKETIYSNPSNGSTIDLIVGSFDTFELNAVATPTRQTQAAQRFKSFIEEARAAYDLIAIDTNPSATFVTMQVLANSNFLIAPITFDAFSMQGIHLVVTHLKDRFEWLANPDRISIVFNKVPRSPREDELARLQREESKIKARYGGVGKGLARCINLERIYSSATIANWKAGAKFIADFEQSIDARLAALHRQHYENVVADFSAVATAINLDLNNVFSAARSRSEGPTSKAPWWTLKGFIGRPSAGH